MYFSDIFLRLKLIFVEIGGPVPLKLLIASEVLLILIKKKIISLFIYSYLPQLFVTSCSRLAFVDQLVSESQCILAPYFLKKLSLALVRIS